ncbi:MAG: TolC family protein, partial [Bacteroidales bacterium]
MPVRTIAPAVFVFLVVAHGTAAQVPGAPAPPPPSPLTLNDAIARALAVYPAVHVASNQVSAADANVAVSRVPYWPRLDLLWQENRATRDNVFGMLLPQAVVPPISGPVQAGSFSDSAWGSAAGMLFSWEPLDFGLRAANVAVATSEVDRTKANVALTRLQVTGATADAFLGLAAAEQALAAANANVRRFDVLTTSVRTLVANELRPGADASRADAELAAARIQAIQAEQRVDVARAALAELLA